MSSTHTKTCFSVLSSVSGAQMLEEKRQQSQKVNGLTNMASIAHLLIDSDTSEFQQAQDWAKAMNNNLK